MCNYVFGGVSFTIPKHVASDKLDKLSTLCASMTDDGGTISEVHPEDKPGYVQYDLGVSQYIDTVEDRLSELASHVEALGGHISTSSSVDEYIGGCDGGNPLHYKWDGNAWVDVENALAGFSDSELYSELFKRGRMFDFIRFAIQKMEDETAAKGLPNARLSADEEHIFITARSAYDADAVADLFEAAGMDVMLTSHDETEPLVWEIYPD